MNAIFEELVESYITGSIGLTQAFLSPALARSLQENLSRLTDAGQMHPAGIGNGNVRDPMQQLRGDRICWIEPGTDNTAEQEFLAQVADFSAYLNSTCYTGINTFEFHYALYETGSFYKLHKDQFKNNSHRKFSLISYLNDDWLEADGGQLCIHREAAPIQRISPEKGKAIFFKSDEMAHEVIPALRPRMSITGWLKQI